MPGPGTHVPLAGNGAITYPAGGVGNLRAKFPLDQLATIGGLGPRKGFMRTLNMFVTMVLTEDGTADTTIDWQKLYDAIERVVFYMQGHEFVNLLVKGATALQYWHTMQNGTLPDMATNLTILKGKTGTVTLVVPIACYDDRSVSPEDDLIPLGLLNGGSFDVDWTSAGQASEFGAHVSLTSGTISCDAEIIERDETRFPALWRLETDDLASKNDSITPDKVLYTDIAILPVNAGGVTAQKTTAAEVAQLTLTQNTRKTFDAVTLATIIGRYNQSQPKSGEAKVPIGSVDLIPLVYSPRSSGKRTHFEPDYAKPKLQVSGTITVARLRIFKRYVFPTGPRTVASLAAKAGEKLPDGFGDNPENYLAGKTSSKVLATTDAKNAFLPQKLYRGGVPGRNVSNKPKAT